MPIQFCGREPIYTDAAYVDYKNIINIVREGYTQFLHNANRCDYLLDYEAGKQPIPRKKIFRPEIDIRCIDNIANEVTNFKRSFIWGSPITLVQRGELDGGGENESKAIAMLNESFDAEDLKTKTQELGRFVEICGHAYTYIDINGEWEEGESLFVYEVLDPRRAFIIKSAAYIDGRDLVDVVFTTDRMGNRHFTCFTKDSRYEINNLLKIENGEELDEPQWLHGSRSGEMNPLGILPFTEWVRDYDRSGCFERQIPDMDTLNILESDFANDVDQNTQTIWHANDVSFEEDSNGNIKRPESGDWLYTFSTADGKTPFINPLSVAYDYSGMLENITTKRTLILQKCGVPQRGDTSGGSTGIAMDGATGWSQAEIAADMQDQIRDGCRMSEVKIALRAVNESPFTPADCPMLELKASDVQPNKKRQKSYEMNTKINALATGISHGIDPKHMIKVVNLFEDPQQVAEDSKPYLDRYLDSVFKTEPETETEEAPNAGRTMQDESDQISNSPNIDGQKTNNGDEENEA